MDPRPFPNTLLSHLVKHERMLSRRYGVRLRVDKITGDGKNALCSIAQLRRRWFRSALSAEEMIELAHAALLPLHRIGLSPLVSALPPRARATFPAPNKNDPFGIRSAMRQADFDAVPTAAASRAVGILR